MMPEASMTKLLNSHGQNEICRDVHLYEETGVEAIQPNKFTTNEEI